MLFDKLVEKNNEKKQAKINKWTEILSKNFFVQKIIEVINTENIVNTINNQTSGDLVTIYKYQINLTFKEMPHLSSNAYGRFTYEENGLEDLDDEGIIALGDLLFNVIRPAGPNNYIFKGTWRNAFFDGGYGLGKGGNGIVSDIRKSDIVDRYTISFEKNLSKW